MRLQVNEAVNTVIQDKAGQIVATCWRSPKKKKTIAKEFVRRWNAFEDGGLVEELRTACKAWEKVESEMRDKTPCPDLALRAQYRKEAVKLTEAALAKS